jgi:hypothetical protein
MDAGFSLDILGQGFSPRDAQKQLDTAIAWGRYAELFDFNTHTQKIAADPDAGALVTPNSVCSRISASSGLAVSLLWQQEVAAEDRSR